MAAGLGKQFLLLFKKNWIIQKRKVCCTIVEIAVPIFLAMVLVLIRYFVAVEDIKDAITWADFDVDSLPVGLKPPGDNGSWYLAYTPDNAATRRMMARVESQLGLYGKSWILIPI